MSAEPPIAVLSDRVAAHNGRAYWNERFFRACDGLGVPLLVIGDADTLRGEYRHVRYLRCPDLPPIAARPDGPLGLGPRPFIALDDPWADAEERDALRLAVAALARAHAPHLGEPAFHALDALRDPGWRAPIAAALAAAIDAVGARDLLVTTQSFLGYAAGELARARPDLRVTYLIHSDYATVFAQRLAAALPPAERGLVRPVVRAMHRRMARASLSPGAAVLVRCPATANLLRLHGPLPEGCRVALLPPGVEAGPAPPARPSPSGALRVLVAARLDADRDHALLPEIARLAGPIRLHIAGGGPLRAELEAALPTATFHGHLAAGPLRALMLESDVLLHTSQTDTFGEAVIEAMAAGLPVVVSNAGGPIGYVLHGHTGLVCDGTPASFAAALRALREDPAQWRDLSRGARAFAERAPFPELVRAVLAELGAPC